MLVRAPVTLGMIPGWADTIFSIEVMSPGLVSEGFLIDSPGCLSLVIHGLLWEFQNRQVTKEGRVITFLIFLGIITLLDNMRRDLKEQWFSLWYQTRSSLLSCPQRSSVDHSLKISYTMSFSPTKSFSTPSKFVVSWNGILVGVRRYSSVSRLSSWPKIRMV